jgi:threonine dehydrogenase-like Zn-dependent dehydrogenase
MRRVVVYPGRIAVEAADIPAPGPDEALVRTIVTGVCGSDLHAAHGRHPFVLLPFGAGAAASAAISSGTRSA